MKALCRITIISLVVLSSLDDAQSELTKQTAILEDGPLHKDAAYGESKGVRYDNCTQ